MAEQLSTPRITASYLDNFVGKVVMLVGKVTQLRGDQATLDSEGTVTVLLDRDAHLSNGNSVQVIGKVNPDLSIKVLTSRDLGTGVDHGPYQSTKAYTPRVAMVWTSPTKTGAVTSPARRRQASSNDQHGKSNVTIPESASTDAIRSSRPLHSAAQRLQRHTHSIYGQSRPATAMSFTTSSSDMILGHDLQSRSSSPPYPSGPSHISQTPTPSLGTLLPSPPEEAYRTYSTEMSRRSSVSTQPNHRYSNSPQSCEPQSTQELYIPSAQPCTPLAYSPPSMSSASLLPSPPMTQDDEFHPSGGPLMSPAFSTSSQLHSVSTGRRFPTGVPTNRSPKPEEPEESELFDSVLEGIGRIHVSMNRDDAGRWRIKRASDERP
ncbi:hypothetical protein F53441_5563 [Fusarium austroafricanum]|uniref:Replication factor A protein 3 n=1 Tax=Fusarium austroafricanum TaxID=2364996 RepID=A0A8H4P0I7_9HYPO|nr:hypothetical protein F53441_5563 [Fusarium austroafricanum]